MTMLPRVPRGFVVAWCVVALGLAGCDAHRPDNTTGPPSTVQHPAPEVPKDRDERSVLAALARIDPCAVLESAVAGKLEARSPSTCQAAKPDGGSVTFGVNTLSASDRLRFPTRTLGGAKAYVNVKTVDTVRNGCTVSFPVSFTHALTIFVDHNVVNKPATDPCVVAETAATAAATTLADPVSARAGARWEACAALGSVPGADPDVPTSMDLCGDKHSLVVFEFKYTTPGSYPFDGWRRTTVGGVEVWTLDDPNPKYPSCTAEWSPGPATSRHAPADAQLVASLRAVDCGRVTPFLEPMINVLRRPPPEVAPQRPLLYGPDEPDSPRPGACAYANLRSETPPCAPYVPVPVPAESGQIGRAAFADPNVHCAVALDAVAKHFGAGMRPVTVPGTYTCYFVQPDRLLQVEFGVSPQTVQSTVDHRPGAQRIEIAGHPGYRRPLLDPGDDHEFWLATSTAADRPDSLVLVLGKGPAAAGNPLPAEVTAKAEPLLADIVRRYFS